MAKVTTKLPEDLLVQLSKLGEKSDEITEKMLQAGGDVVKDAMKEQLKSVVGKDTKYPSRSTGQLIESVGKSGVRLDRNGNMDIKVGFDDHRNDGKTNTMIANILEYGRSNQEAKPFIKKTKSRSKRSCEESMADVFETEVKKIVDT